MQRFPIIVLEGPDCTGKTTLGQKLAAETNGRYLHLTYRWPAKMHHYHHAAMELALKWAETKTVILDRWWPSEVVYAAAFRGGSPWPMASRMFERVGLKHGIHYVLSMPFNREQYLEFYRKTKAASEDVLGDRGRVFDLYEQWALRNRDADRYDLFNADETTIASIHETAKLKLEDILRASDLWETDAIQHLMPNRLDRRSAGNLRSFKMLLIGDQSNPKTRRKAWPFFEHANSSLWLTTKLEELGLMERDLAWINLHDENGRMQFTPAELYNLTMRAHITVALGSNVRDTLRVYKIEPIFALHHPQYYRRFKPQTTDLNVLGKIFAHDPAYESAARQLGLVSSTS